MQYGLGNIENLASALVSQGSKIVLGFNEPDFDQQADLDPTYAAQLWMQYMNPLKDLIPGIRIGAPAVSSSGTGQPWLQQFFTACNSNCSIDFLPLHWYGVGVAGLYDYMYQIHGQYPSYPIWMTEYADTSLNETEVMLSLNQSIAYFDTLEWVERYAWFGYFRPQNGSAYNFMDADGGLDSLGEVYIGAGTIEESGTLTAASTTAIGPGGGGGGPTLITVSAQTDGPIPTFASSGVSARPSLLWISFLMLCFI